MSNLKHHHIRFKQTPAWGSTNEWEDELAKLDGVRRVDIDTVKRDVFVEYDLLKCREEDIERWLVEAGFTLDDSLLQKFKRGWIQFTEENELDNLKSKPRSCCDMDEIERKKRQLE